MSGVPEKVLVQKRGQLADCEAQIKSGLESVAKNLAIIKSQELWALDGYKSFEDYCQRRWNWKKSQAYNMIAAAKVVANIADNSTMVEKSLPTHERQTRELAKAPADKQAEAWTLAQEATGQEQPTAAACAAAVRKVSPALQQLADDVASGNIDPEPEDADKRPEPDEYEDEPGIVTADEEREQAQLQINIEREMWRCFMQAYNIADKAKNFKLLAEYSNKMANMAAKRMQG